MLSLRRIGALFLLLPLLALISCSASVYLPSASHTPMFAGAGDVQLAGSVGTNLQYDGSIAYSPIDHLGFVAGASRNPSTEHDTIFDHGHTYGELGAVYYARLSDLIGASFSNSTQIELSAGAGLGEATSRSFTPARETDIGPLPYRDSITTFINTRGSYARYYLQALLGFREPLGANERAEFGLGGRFAHTRFHELHRDDTALAPLSSLNFEFLAFARFYFGRVGFEMQLGTTTPLPQDDLFQGNFQVLVGTRIALGRLYREPKGIGEDAGY